MLISCPKPLKRLLFSEQFMAWACKGVILRLIGSWPWFPRKDENIEHGQKFPSSCILNSVGNLAGMNNLSQYGNPCIPDSGDKVRRDVTNAGAAFETPIPGDMVEELHVLQRLRG